MKDCLKSLKVFLVGKVLSFNPINKESFKRQIRNLWRPKDNVLIFDLEDDRFTFGFNNLYERTSILRGGPWLFNKQFLLLLTEADIMAHPTTFVLSRIMCSSERAVIQLHDRVDG